MKKRMLVTTIALVLVIAVALTTSSLAWFSSSSSVHTGTVDFTAVSASGTNLVLGDYGQTDLTLYGNSVTFTAGGNYKPVQGKVTFEGAIEKTNNKLTFTANPFYTPTEKGVVQESGYDVQGQKVTFQAASHDDYYAGGFNFANATGDAISGGVTLNATITLEAFGADVGADAGKVKKGYVAYEGGWKNAGDDVTDPTKAVFYEAQDVALVASIRIAVCGAANVLAGATYDDDLAKVYAWGDKGFTLDNTGYALTTGDSQTKYVPDDPTGSAKVYTDATGTYATINGITYADGEFTFSYSFAGDISADNAGSIAFVIWMDGWDESALPGVSEGDFTIGFELTK